MVIEDPRFVTSGHGVPKTTSPISQAVVAGNSCYISGQLPVDHNGLLKRGSFESQVRLTLRNLVAVARAAGYTVAEIVYLDVALLDIRDMPIVNRVFASVFPAGRRPARTVYQAAALPLGSRIKLQGIAYKS